MIADLAAELLRALAHQRARARRGRTRAPCEKLRRTTSTPAASMRDRTAGELHAGPSVATILVLRDTFDILGDVAANVTANDGLRCYVQFARDPGRDAVAAAQAGLTHASSTRFSYAPPAPPPPAASCLRGIRGTRRRRSRCSRCGRRRRTSRSRRACRRRPRSRRRSRRAIARASAFVPPANASNSNTPTGPFQTMVPARAMIVFSAATDVGPDVEDQVVGLDVLDRLQRRLRVLLNSLATTASTGIGTLPGNSSRIAFASPTRSGSASDLPMLPPAARMNVLAMPPPTISASTFAASARRIVSLVETFDPATIATSGRFGRRERRAERVELGRQQRTRAGDRRELRDAVRRGLGAMRGAERVVDVDVAELRHLAARARRRSSSRPC